MRVLEAEIQQTKTQFGLPENFGKIIAYEFFLSEILAQCLFYRSSDTIRYEN
jgi:hypothetical protein